MKPFLKETLERILRDHPADQLDQVTIVFNNRRPSIFLRDYLNQLFPQPHFEPRMIGFDDLIAELGSLEIIRNEFLLFELFKVHQRHGAPYKSTFDEFVTTADIILSDFGEVDRYMVDASKLYINLADCKEIDIWSVSGEKPSDFQLRYLEFYQSLLGYYNDFRETLRSKGQAYAGMAYREVAENIDRILDSATHLPYIYFVGFNALSAAEKKIIDAYIKRGVGHFVPDGDPYYIDNDKQEAGHFLRKHRGLFDKDQQFADHFSAEDKEISIVKSPDNVSQAKYAGQLISSLLKDKSDEEKSRILSNTAIVLSDESLLPSVLNALPVSSANITMGLPFTSSDIHSFVVSLFSLYKRSRNGKEKGTLFFNSDVLDIVGNSRVSSLLGSGRLYTDLYNFCSSHQLVSLNLGVLRSSDDEKGLGSIIADKLNPVADLFQPLQKPIDIIDRINIVLNPILSVDRNNTESAVHREYAAAKSLAEILDHIKSLAAAYPDDISTLATLERLYLRIVKRYTINFRGEPLNDLQILGVLETRNLNFERVILLTANEGVFPASRNDNTLIPYSLKKPFGMPTYTEKDSVYAYNFYHLIQHAKEIYITYSTDTDGPGKGAPSRFLLQLREELVPRFSNIKLHEQSLSIANNSFDTPAVDSATKTEDVLTKLSNIAFSPSSLNTYRACPLKFYYDKVLRYEETEDIDDDFNAAEIGTIVHSYLENLYNQWRDKPLTVKFLEDVLNDTDFEGKIMAHIQNEKRYNQIDTGKNYINTQTIIDRIRRFLKNEIKTLENDHTIIPLYLEYTYTDAEDKKFDIEVDGHTRHFRCTADRIDKFDGIVRILDYKTGKVDEDDLKINTEKKLSDKAFQVLFYAWCYTKINELPEDTNLLGGIYDLRSCEYKPLTIDDSEFITHKNVEAFEAQLTDIFKEMFNLSSDAPEFVANGKNCKYCVVNDICTKGKESSLSEDDE